MSGSAFPIDGAGFTHVPVRVATSADIRVECVGVDRLGDLVAAWKDLCARALEPNIFLDPAFALPLFRHASRGQGPSFLLVWTDEPSCSARLVGLFPLAAHSGLGAVRRCVLHEQTSNGTPLVDRADAAAVIDAALNWLGRTGRGFAAALAVSAVQTDGPFATELRRVCAASSRHVAGLNETSRAVLKHLPSADGCVISLASAKRRKQYARQVRRLARQGNRTFVTAQTPAEIASATEQFLVLEQAGWKGTRGTALLDTLALTAFAREMICAMGREGRCRIDSLEVDGRPVAMMIVFTDGARAYLWKTAFDEAYALWSPGVQLTLELTRRQLADPAVALTDSCTSPDHPVLDRLWADRIAMIDLLVATRPANDRAFQLALRVERMRRATRQAAKRLWLAARRWGKQLKKTRRAPILR